MICSGNRHWALQQELKDLNDLKLGEAVSKGIEAAANTAADEDSEVATKPAKGVPGSRCCSKTYLIYFPKLNWLLR